MYECFYLERLYAMMVPKLSLNAAIRQNKIDKVLVSYIIKD